MSQATPLAFKLHESSLLYEVALTSHLHVKLPTTMMTFGNSFATSLFLVATVVFSVLIPLVLTMDAPPNEYGGRDLLAAGILSEHSFSAQIENSNSGGARKSVTTSRNQALLIATAKVHGRAHRSKPFIMLDIDQTVSGCRPFDWIFNPACPAPMINKKVEATHEKELHHSILYVFVMPKGWENLRLTLPLYDECGFDGKRDRTAFMRYASSHNACMRAEFRRQECRRSGFLFFKKTKCNLVHCDPMAIMSRLITLTGAGADTKYYIASDNGIQILPSDHCLNLFLK